MTSPDNDDRVPQLRRPLRPDRPGVRGLRRTGATPRTLATELGSDTTLPRRAARHHRPRRGVRHLRLLHRDRARRHQRGPARGRRHHRGRRSRRPGRTTRRRPTTTPSSPASRAPTASLGWVGFAFAEQAGDGVTEIPIAAEPGGECVAPTAETIADSTYPISRNLYIYVNAAMAEENAAVAAFVDFYLSDDGHRVGRRRSATWPSPTTSSRPPGPSGTAQETGTRDGG